MCLFTWSNRLAALCLTVLLCGCASTQLNYNTLDISNTVGDLYTRQTLANLSRYIDDPMALPSQLDLLQGTIQTSNSVTPTVTAPFTASIVNGLSRASAVGTTTHTATIAGSGISLCASDTWQQNWNVVPMSDQNTLRNLRALYRHVLYPNSSLQIEYTVARLAVDGKTLKDRTFPPDPYALQEPQQAL